MAQELFTIEEIAEVCHEANRVLQRHLNEDAVSPRWAEAPEWQRESAIDGVRNARAGASPEESHLNWLEFKEKDGWVYGETKDEDAKTHPCMVPYDELPPEQRSKDALFTSIVRALS